jgi:hypothetical protein
MINIQDIVGAQKVNTKRTNNPITKSTNELSRQFSEELKKATKCMKKLSTLLAIKEMQNLNTYSISPSKIRSHKKFLVMI